MSEPPLKLNNFWLTKAKEKTLLKVVEWAHRNDKLVENLTAEDIREAIKSHLREAHHAS